MAFKEENSINFDKLEKELQAAVDADAKYWRENDAKFRAIEQKVATYDEFKDIVSASHLKPLDKGDKINDKFMQPWNMQAKKHKDESKQPLETQINKDKQKVPKNGHEFTIHWRRYCKTTEDKYNYIIELGAEQLGKILKSEVSFGLLGDFMEVLTNYKEKNLLEVINILTALSKVNRFSLSIDFFSESEKKTCAKLFNKLTESGDKLDNDETVCKDLLNLKEVYGIKEND